MNRNYWKFWTAAGATNLGDGVAMVAYPWLATLITDNPFEVALVAASTKLPWLLFTLPAGVITDRYSRRKILIVMDILRFILTLAVVAVAFNLDGLSGTKLPLYGLISAAFLLGMAEVLRDNAAQTMLPEFVPAKDLEKANANLWSVQYLTNEFIGPPLAGLLIAIALPLPFLFDSITFLLAAVLVATISVPKSPEKTSHQPALEALKEGFIWLWQRPVLRNFALILGMMNMAHLMTASILVLFAQDVLHLTATQFGIMLTGGAAGGVIGGMVAPKIIQRTSQFSVVICAIFAMVFVFLTIALTSNPIIVWCAMFVEVFAAILWNTVTVSLRQRVIPAKLLGRVNSAYRFFGWGMMPIGALLGGLIVNYMDQDFAHETALRTPFFCAALVNALIIIALVKTISQKKIDALEAP